MLNTPNVNLKKKLFSEVLYIKTLWLANDEYVFFFITCKREKGGYIRTETTSFITGITNIKQFA